jgi:hypothetical protein
MAASNLAAAMASLTSKIDRIRRDHGLRSLVRRALFAAYRRSARRLLPDVGYVQYGGLAVGRTRKRGDKPLFDRFLPPDLQDNPIYEKALLEGLRANVRPGDRVVVIGGGEGITAAMAALLTGDKGRVTCFEGDRAGIGAVMRTAAANDVADRVSCVYAVVGENLGVFGTDVSDKVIAPADLPDCDVLEMDCEGSEVGILRGMRIRPRVVVVETHGFAGASTGLVVQILEECGYAAEDIGLAEPKPACVGRDEHVVVGIMDQQFRN